MTDFSLNNSCIKGRIRQTKINMTYKIYIQAFLAAAQDTGISGFRLGEMDIGIYVRNFKFYKKLLEDNKYWILDFFVLNDNLVM